MDILNALADCGSRPDLLSAEQRQQLDEQGFLVLPELLSQQEIAGLRQCLEALYEREGQAAGLEVHQEEGTRRLSDLVNKGQVFDAIYTQPQVLAAVHHVIGRDFKLSSLNARDALPGHGAQGLHCDWGDAYNDLFHVCNSIFLLDDMDEENGCTRLVPGSQYEQRLPHESGIDVNASHPQEIKLIAPAGTVCVFNSHVWHGGTLNISQHRSRRAIHCFFTAREHEQQLDQQEYIRVNTFKRISPAARYILDVHD